MGQEIVYCEACGVSLREADFAKGKACEVDHRPYCTACAPFRPPAPEPARPSRKVSSGHLEAIPGTPRRAIPTVPAAKGPQPAVIAGIVGGVVLLIVLIAFATSGGTPTPPPANAPSRTGREPVLEPREKSAPPPRRTEEEPRRLASGARDADTLREPTEEEKSARFEAFLAQIRTRIAEDPGFQRRTEVERMIAAAEKMAGTRAAQVREVRSLYEKSLEDAGKAAIDAARAEAETLWSQKKYAEAVERARTIPEAFHGTRRAEELRAFADDLAKRATEAAEKDRLEALGPWKVWKVESSGEAGMPKLLDSYAGRQKVFETHPLTREKPGSLERTVEIPAGKKTTLSLWVAPHQQGDWELRVLADGKLIHKQEVTPPNSGWKQVKVDLTPFAGKKILLRLENAATGWAWEFGFWSDIELKSD
jgi:hypothetical protein